MNVYCDTAAYRAGTKKGHSAFHNTYGTFTRAVATTKRQALMCACSRLLTN